MLKKEEVIKRVKHWQDILGLSNWDIKIKIVDSKKMLEIMEEDTEEDLDTLAAIDECHPVEHIAQIVFLKNADKNFGLQINLDTLIIHELIHILIGEKFDSLPGNMPYNPKVRELEEFICDTFSMRIYKAYNQT